MPKIFNNKKQTPLRQLLRKEAPQAERNLWQVLKGKNIDGLKFRRQVSIGRYVADFYCPAAKLVIEIDGSSHFQGEDVEKYDAERQEVIESLGLTVLRFTNNDVYESLDGVVDNIRECLNAKKAAGCGLPPPPAPPPGGGEFRTPPFGGGAGEVGASGEVGADGFRV